MPAPAAVECCYEKHWRGAEMDTRIPLDLRNGKNRPDATLQTQLLRQGVIRRNAAHAALTQHR